MEFQTIAAVAGTPGLVAVASAVFFAGLRHGFDIDHIAAISDITSSQLRKRRALLLATIYATGHGVVLFGLGLLAIVWGQKIPDRLDSFFGRVIGVTLVVLGVYVVYSLIRFRKDFRLRSRWMYVVIGARRALQWLRRNSDAIVTIDHVHEHSTDGHHNAGMTDEPDMGGSGRTAIKTRTHVHTHRHTVVSPGDPFTEYGAAATFGIGMIHGVGAETPTQILLLTTAAGLAGTLGGLVVLGAFVFGLFVGNSVLAIVTTFGFSRGQRIQGLYVFLAASTAVLSVYIGLAYALDRADLLPRFLGG
jgi:hypothetical protein